MRGKERGDFTDKNVLSRATQYHIGCFITDKDNTLVTYLIIKMSQLKIQLRGKDRRNFTYKNVLSRVAQMFKIGWYILPSREVQMDGMEPQPVYS